MHGYSSIIVKMNTHLPFILNVHMCDSTSVRLYYAITEHFDTYLFEGIWFDNMAIALHNLVA